MLKRRMLFSQLMAQARDLTFCQSYRDNTCCGKAQTDAVRRLLYFAQVREQFGHPASSLVILLLLLLLLLCLRRHSQRIMLMQETSGDCRDLWAALKCAGCDPKLATQPGRTAVGDRAGI